MCPTRADPWAFVRTAAIYGLSTRTDGFDCIQEALNDGELKVKQAAIEVIGESASLLAPYHRAQSIARLKHLVKNSRASAVIREKA